MMKAYLPGMGSMTNENDWPNVGVWMFEGETAVSVCSQCKGKYYIEPTNYCPNCGARMFNQKTAAFYYNDAYKAILDRVEETTEGASENED